MRLSVCTWLHFTQAPLAHISGNNKPGARPSAGDGLARMIVASWIGGTLLHRMQFDVDDGEVTAGPASEKIFNYKIEAINNTLYLDLDQ